MADLFDKTTMLPFWSGYLSQWEPSTFDLEGHTFTCAEQWMMWSKAHLFGDEETARQILATSDPREQKLLGRQVRNFDPAKWDERKVEIVYRGTLAKFSQNEKFRRKLLATGDKVIVEASPVDTIWGVGLHRTDPLIWDRANWRGQNLLGKILMQVREELSAEL